MSWIIATALVVPILLAASIALTSRRKKYNIDELRLIGKRAYVERQLNPLGAVIVAGELWPAESRTTEIIKSGKLVRVVGARDHLLIVKLDH